MLLPLVMGFLLISNQGPFTPYTSQLTFVKVERRAGIAAAPDLDDDRGPSLA